MGADPLGTDPLGADPGHPNLKNPAAMMHNSGFDKLDPKLTC